MPQRISAIRVVVCTMERRRCETPWHTSNGNRNKDILRSVQSHDDCTGSGGVRHFVKHLNAPFCHVHSSRWVATSRPCQLFSHSESAHNYFICSKFWCATTGRSYTRFLLILIFWTTNVAYTPRAPARNKTRQRGSERYRQASEIIILFCQFRWMDERINMHFLVSAIWIERLSRRFVYAHSNKRCVCSVHSALPFKY